PTEVANAVKEEFGVTIERWQVEEYDPAKRKPAQKWCAMHAAIRKAFLEEISGVPAAKKAVRVRHLASMAAVAKSKKNYVVAAQLYEQIAKEMGDAYTNRRVIVPANPLEELAKALGVSPDQLAVSLDLVDPTGATDGGTDSDETSAPPADAKPDA
ncbi:MAG: DUF2280 domain-containing protein, partial [bacterium]